MANGKTLCLNMIVKNEMANLDRCLRAVADHITCWVIGDTGSTDGTQDFIQSFFAERGIPGELHSFPFLNFGQARNAALEHAAASKLAYDYLLLDDADMELVVEDPGFRAKLDAPGYLLIQKTDSGLAYWNTRLVRRDTGARYHGVTHEYLDVPGGRENLQGVWYRDHASGSNRVEKFERDINLLLQGLEEEPGNSRYWFYLAQSYRDAGQKAKAAETYAKRAAMGGWDEEAWYARLQQARCLRDLKDDDGFTREALAAFNQRPQRAEPLYDLARFYRERGDHAASVLFSEFGLTLPRPNDILFLEDFVYTAGLLEEFSIAANYAHDAARKDRGFAACNSLALNRDVPEGTRKLARTNLFYYIEPAGAMMPSFAAHPVVFTPPPGYHLTNPSIARLGEQLVMVQRTVNYVITGDNQYETPSGAPVHTRNFLLRLDPALQVQSSLEILPPVDMPEPSFQPVTGFEDMRLFAWRGELWSSSTVRELTAEGWCEQMLARIDQSMPGDFRLTDWRVFHPEGPRLHQKNWMPLVDGDRLQFVYLCDPTRILDEQAQKIAETVPPIAAEQFRGGSQAIAFDGGWLALIHEVLEPAASRPRTYQHRFVWLDEARVLRRVSRAFYFHKKGVEFAAGLAWHPDGKRLMISFSVGDHESWIATVEADDVLGVPQDVGSLPSGTTGGLRGDSLPVRLPTKEAAKSGENPTRPGSSADIDPARNRDPEEHINDLLQTLRHLVGGRPIAMLDWPSYVNSGDHLIWLGEKVLLKERLGCKVLYECSLHQFDFLAVSRLPSDAVLVMHGGGNFGDLYDQHERFREATAAGFSDRRIIFMPQTVRFASQKNLEESARRLKLHPDLHVMARDRKSFEIIRSQMGLTNCYLHIDSAFALQPIVTALQRNFAVNAQHDAVYLLRGDVESTRELSPPDGAVRYDWARTYDLDPFAKDLPSPESIGFGAACFEGALDTVSWERLCAVVRMLSTGQRIVTDRLHGHILAIMMKKQHELHDNNYGKNRSFYQTWTSANPFVTFVGRDEKAERAVEAPPESKVNHAAELPNEEHRAQPSLNSTEQQTSSPKIPRIFHFITGLDANFGGRPFSFVHYMAIRSALRVNKNFRARVYYHYEPSGEYWDAVKGEVEPIRVDLPTEVFGNPVELYAHKADVLRMQVLLEHGGIYLDLDTICQRPFEPLLDGRVVMGREERSAPNGERSVVGLCNATIIAPPNAEFLRLWYDAYREFKGGTVGDAWNKFSVQVPMALAREHPSLLRIEPASSFFWPSWDEAGIASMFAMDRAFPDAYSFHLWEGASFKFTKELDLHSVLTVDTTYNKLARRFVEDGQPALEDLSRQFSKVYDQGVWGPGSGVGSLPQHTVEYRDFLKQFIQENGIKSVVDLGCGDWQFSRHIDWSGITYTGVDIVASLIEKNQREFGRDGNITFHKFESLDKLPSADLLICKDVLQHLSNNMVKAYLAEFKQKYKFSLVTNDDEPVDLQNIDIAAGGWRTLRLDLEPFCEPGEIVLSWTVPWGKATTHKVTYLIHGT